MLKVIIISENQETLGTIATELAGHGYSATLLHGLDKFISYTSEHPVPDPGLKGILGELELSGEGREPLLKHVRSGAYASIPVVLMGTVMEQGTVKNLLQQGVDGILCKPFTTGALIRQLEQAASRREKIELDQIMGGINIGNSG